MPDIQRAPLDSPPPPAIGATRRVDDPGLGATLGLPGIAPSLNAETLLTTAMEQEIKLRELAVMFPELAPLAAQFIDALRAAASSRIQGGGQPQPGAPVGQPMNAMAGMMGAPQPAGPGAAAPPPMM